MQVFFDTTVLVAASEQSHPHHAQALPALRRVVAGHDGGFVSAHSIAETYAALTCATTCAVERISTLNLSNFCQLATPDQRLKVMAP